MRHTWLLVGWIAATAACGDDGETTPAPTATTPPPPPPLPTYDYPLDDVLRVHHLQAKSTHNSYHQEPVDNELDAWRYTHLPLDQQLDQQGVRHVELDVRLDSAGYFVVFHLPIVDDRSTCFVFTDCLAAMKSWSDAHPAHHPIVVQMEFKDMLPADPEAYFAKLHAEILSVWPVERIVTPGDVRGSHATIADALSDVGWPTLGATRARVIFTIDDRGAFRDAYTFDKTSLDGRLLFADGDPGEPYAAIGVRNDPIADAAAIEGAIAARMLVRTRADSDSVEPLQNDVTRREAALASSSHFVSTDYPAPVENTDYWVEIPDGAPTRCNPITAPAECTSEAIEDPAFIAAGP